MSKRFTYWVLAILLLLLFSEGIVRLFFKIKGYQTEVFTPFWEPFVLVDSLIVEEQFYSNNQGLFLANSRYWKNDKTVSLNSQNFRGREFVKNDSTSTILHLGDSFTWGADASSYENCFVRQIEVLSGDKITSFNAGIPGTDPAQYELLTKTYLLAVSPDVVSVHLFLGNDLMPTSREIKPNKPLYYQTNAGWLPGFYKNKYFDNAEESYDFLKQRYLPKTTIEKIISKTALGTLIITLPLRIEEYQNWQKSKVSFVTNMHLKNIKKLCEKAGVKFMLFVIPSPFADLGKDYDENPIEYLFKKYPIPFEGLKNDMYPYPVKAEHFKPAPNSHFNDSGHLVAAKFIIEKIKN